MTVKDIKETVRRVKLGSPDMNAYDILKKSNVTIGTFDTNVYDVLPKGCYYKFNGIKTVLTHPDLSYEGLNIVYTHELGHSLLHPNINTLFLERYDSNYVNRIEREANIFTAEFLLEGNIFKEYKGYTIAEIASIKNVSPELVALKYENLDESELMELQDM